MVKHSNLDVRNVAIQNLGKIYTMVKESYMEIKKAYLSGNINSKKFFFFLN